jgi:RNA methyltransferase, TrmH family
LDSIHSRQNPVFRHALKLSESRRERLHSGLVLLSGTHLALSALHTGWTLQRVLLREGQAGNRELDEVVEQSRAPVTTLAGALFDEIEQMASPSGLLAIGVLPKPPTLRHDGACVLLDGIQDPGNVGTILRTAAAAGVDQAWLGMGCADAWSPKVLRAAMGAHFVLPVIERVDCAAAMDAFSGARAITTLERAQSLYQVDLRGDLLLALGAEGRGVSHAVASRATLRVHIPMQAGVESLNVAAAAAVCLFERRRQMLARAGSEPG